MPFKSEAQRRLFYAKADKGEISKSTVEKWEKETKDKDLPEKVKKAAYALGCQYALQKFALDEDLIHTIDPNKASRWVYRGSRVIGVPAPISLPVAKGFKKVLTDEQKAFYNIDGEAEGATPQTEEVVGQPEPGESDMGIDAPGTPPEGVSPDAVADREPGESYGEAEGQEFGQQMLPKQPPQESGSAKEEIGKVL